MLWHN